MKKYLFIGFVTFLFLSCEESNINVNETYIGFWSSIDGDVTYTLDVQSNGSCNYKVSTRYGNKLSYSGFEGKFMLQDSILKIGSESLRINKAPMLSNGKWYLTMENHNYTRK
jgi:hypothetical protein